jgi:eukaryotic-like serine/threonine-protein kinase
MPDETPQAVNPAEVSVANGRLDSWKEIAVYLKRDVTTVRRWEKRQGLPVHRHLHERRDSVYAYAEEIDRWWESRRKQLTDTTAPNGETRDSGEGGIASDRAAVTPPLRARLAWTLAATFFVATLVVASLVAIRDSTSRNGEQAEVRFSMFPPENTSFGSVSLSPDGRQVAFTAVPIPPFSQKKLLWVRRLDTLAAQPLRDTEDASFPFWSPASDALGFFAGGKLWIVQIPGGSSPRAVAEAPNGRGGTWNQEGVIVFAPHPEGALLRVASTGGTASPVTTVTRPQERGHLWPEFLPDGRHFIYLADGAANAAEHHNLFVGALDSPERKVIAARASSNATYGAGGHLFFTRERKLMAQPFDPAKLALTGEAVAIFERVQAQMGFDHKMDFSVSANGVLAQRSMQSPATRLIWRDRGERDAAFVSTPAEYYDPTLSPDGTRVAVAQFDPQPSRRFGFGVVGMRSDMLLVDSQTAEATQFTTDPHGEWGPVWSPDGRRLVFSSNRRGRLELYERSAERNGGEEQLLLAAETATNPVAQSWSRDGKFLVYSAVDPTTHSDLWLLPMAGAPNPEPLLRSEHNERQGQVSPDGRWLAYTSDESGRDEVYVQRLPPGPSTWRISKDGGGDPRWRFDGKELYYVGNDRRFMAVAINPGARFDHGSPVPLFDTGVPPHWYAARNLYDVSRDGRFLFMTPVEDDRSSPFTIVINWKRPTSAR